MILKKNYVLIALIVSACASTKIERYTAPPRVLEGEGILLMQMENIEESVAFPLISRAEHVLKNNKVKYLPEQEYDLLSRGVNRDLLKSKQMPDSIMRVISGITQCRYFVYSKLVSSKEGDTWGYYSADELNRYNAPLNQDNEVNRAIFLFKVVDTQGGFHESEFQVKTTLSPMTFGDETETRVNVTSRTAAISKAFTKAMKYLQKGVIDK